MFPFFLYMVFSFAFLKSDMQTFILLDLSASKPASVQMALISAPERSSLARMNSSRSTSSANLILLVWIWKILLFVLTSGRGNSILRSILPGLINAGSSDSILFVAMMTLTSDLVSNPSSWLSSSSMVLWISFSPPEFESYLFVPTASISSMNTIEGAISSAAWKISLTSFGPSPKYFWMSSDPTTLKNVADVWLATALASNVFPVPGFP
mmetsp:Transcript_41059/g.47243  ORF Transcript_41059/g.47243 Transcript_41059/m.47243 type:complete len:210 (-) Transcript_41059:705-1334(-)